MCLAGVSIYDAYETRAVRLDEREGRPGTRGRDRAQCRQELWRQAAAGSLPVAEAQKRAMDSIRAVRYGTEGYVTIFDSHPTMLMHPTQPQMVGRDLSDYQGPERRPQSIRISSLSSSATARALFRMRFRGRVPYESSPKISYAVSYQPWDWILNTGVYVDDLDAAFRKSLYQSLGVLLVLAGALSGVVVMLNRGILRSLGGEPSYAAEIANQIANNDLTVVVKTALNDRSSLQFSMKCMQEQLTRTISTIKISAESIATATHQIAAGNQNLSQRTEEQAASLEETAASMEQLTSMVAPECQQCQSGQPARRAGRRSGGTRRRRCVARGGNHERHQCKLGPDRQYCRHHRRHCLPDQYPRAECGRRSGPGR